MLRIKTEDLVEAFRVKLGLLPWAEHEHSEIEQGARDGRYSGRTTRTILEALAFAALHPDSRLRPDHQIVISVDPPLRAHVRNKLREYALRLGLDETRLDVTSHQSVDKLLAERRREPTMDRRRIQCFVDHYDEEYEQALALVKRRDAIRKGEV